LVRAIRHEGLVKPGCSGLVETLEEVSVEVKGHLDRGMSEPSLDDFGVFSLGDE
jgi:hypothetical protein